MGGSRPTLIVNPIGDRTFSGFAHSQLADASTPAELETLLRARYPHSVVRPRELSGDRILVWYVYRDGRWARPESDQV